MGLVINCSSSVRQSGSTSRSTMPAVASVTSRDLQLHLASVDRPQQFRQVGGDEVDHVRRQCLVRRQARAFPHGTLGPFDVTAPQLTQATDIGDGVVDCLALHGAARLCRRAFSVRLATGWRFGLVLRIVIPWLLVWRRSRLVRSRAFGLRIATGSPDLHRRCGPEIRRRSHGGDMTRVHQVGARTGCASAARCDVADDRDIGRKDGLHHVAHGGLQTAGRIDAHDDEFGARFLCRPDLAHEEIAGGRSDRPLHRKQDAPGPVGHCVLRTGFSPRLRAVLCARKCHQHRRTSNACQHRCQPPTTQPVMARRGVHAANNTSRRLARRVAYTESVEETVRHECIARCTSALFTHDVRNHIRLYWAAWHGVESGSCRR